MNSNAGGNALHQTEEPGYAEQPADGQFWPSGGDYRTDYRVDHLPEDPDSIVRREGGRPAHPGTGEAERQVEAITQDGQRHYCPAEPRNGASRHQRTSTLAFVQPVRVAVLSATSMPIANY
jgi:hypothetical protein